MGAKRVGLLIRRGVAFLVAGLGLAGLGLPAAAQALGLELGVLTSQALYYPGETLSLGISADNPGLLASADFYAGLVAPDGITVVTLGPDGSPSLGSLGDLAGLRPLARGVSLGTPFAVAVDPLLRYVWTGLEPVGLYTAFLVAVRPGSLADGRLDPGDLLAVQTGGLSLFRPAQATVEAGQAVSAVLSVAGGSLSVTSLAGHQFSLTVPAGALREPVTITLTPVASVSGLPLTGALLAAVRIEPAGVRFQPAATLSVTLPGGAPLPGVVGFTVNGDGTGFATQPAGVSGATLTLQVADVGAGGPVAARPAGPGAPAPRESVSSVVKGWGISFCGPEVTSAIGLDACREMAESLAFTAGLTQELELDGLPLPLRVQLAGELVTQLRHWLEVFIKHELEAATDPTAIDPTVDYFFLVALREYEAVRAILALAEALDPTVALTQELAAVNGVIPEAFKIRRQVANEQCLADQDHYRTYIQRLFEMAGVARRLNFLLSLAGVPPVPETVGLTCITLEGGITFPDPVPAGGAEFIGSAVPFFANGAELPTTTPRPLVSIQLVSQGLATIAEPHQDAQPGRVELRTMVGFGPGSATTLEFVVRREVAEFELVRQETVTRCKGGSALLAGVCVPASCVFPPDVLPPGSYLESCISCTVAGTLLTCSCPRIDAVFQTAQKNFSTCGTGLANTNGVLTCGACPGN